MIRAAGRHDPLKNKDGALLTPVIRCRATEGVITPNQIPLTTIVTYLQKRYRIRISNHWATIPAGVITPNQIPLTTIVTYLQKSYRSRISNHWATIPAGVITLNKIPLTTIVTYLQKSYKSRISNHWATHYTCMQCGTSHLQTVQENILSHIILATYRKLTVATVRFRQNVSCNIYTHPIYQHWQMSLCNNSSDNKSY